jgi:hypothetical protein
MGAFPYRGTRVWTLEIKHAMILDVRFSQCSSKLLDLFPGLRIPPPALSRIFGQMKITLSFLASGSFSHEHES